ncbi:probable sodium/potassium/calcium exchanger CG1090 [Anthonomus grandis grandis]|uniref:probable sodium/potassium/calcium exchanger CG1090 n=1 Tax=Anthonomus grandis grandis TaxID=2921223 RepID=UPI002165FE51|nr:probable sodium/potassium/calcium exchanger CG1090 [Anthonomus grandis grandis]
MKKSGRHKLVIKISLIFLIYSVIAAVKSDKKNEEKDISKTTEDDLLDYTSTELPDESTTVEEDIDKDQNNPSNAGSTSLPTVGNKNEQDKSKPNVPPKDSKMPHGTVLTEKAIPKKVATELDDNSNCTPAAIRQFPRPLMSPKTRKYGGLIIDILVAIYMFIGLAIVCDEYFVASLDRICEELKMSPDVAGATFMAAGSSAPELATVIIGVFYAEDDIGISGVIGSAVFNIMFVISVCALATSAIIYLNWWPLIRDSTFYAISILIMLIVIDDKKVSWIESLIMLLVYVVYCIVLHFNTSLEKWAFTLPVPFNQTRGGKPLNEQSGLVGYQNLDEEAKYISYGNVQPTEERQQTDKKNDEYNWNPGQDWSPERTEPQPIGTSELRGAELNRDPLALATAPPMQAQPPPQQPDYYKPKEFDPSTKIDPLLKPEDGASIWMKIKWGTLYPIHFFCIYTMPDCRTDKYKNWYPFTFFISMVWISFYSYFMVWMITIIGYTLGVPDTVMGLTFVAAGVSVPDALSSIAVIKEGYGDMAVSNAIGSNVFDILVCLGLPWFLKTAVFSPGTYVRVISKGLLYSTLSLLSTVAFLVLAVHYNGWKLDRKFGIVLMIWYVLFITFASLYELNIFGNMNPAECPTDY